LLTEPLNVHSDNNIGIVFVPIPASIVKTIEGIDIKQTSLFFNIGNILLFSEVQASTPNSIISPRNIDKLITMDLIAINIK